MKAPHALLFDWTGFYIGAHAGYSHGTSGAALQDPTLTSVSGNFSGVVGGVQAGYNWRLPSGLLLGVEGDLTFPSYLTSNFTTALIATPRSSFSEQWDYVSTARGRIGYAQGRWLAYATGGLAVAGERFLNTPAAGTEEKHIGAPARLERGRRSGIRDRAALDGATGISLQPVRESQCAFCIGHAIRFHAGFPVAAARPQPQDRLAGIAKGGATDDITDPEFDRWEIHGQTTFLPQGYPAFHAPYSGPNSLTPASQLQQTWSNSLYLERPSLGRRRSLFQSGTAAGIRVERHLRRRRLSKRRSQKSNFPYPHFNPSRLFVRQTFGFGGEQEQLASGPLQLGGKADISRVTVQAGKFSVTDVFDGNSYARDPRKDFMNWALWSPGAFDYAADKVGLGYGVTAELNQKQWAVRGGYFLTGAEPNSNSFDTKLVQRGGYVVELETRYQLFSQPGKLRTLGWINNTYSGSYRDTLNNPALNLDISRPAPAVRSLATSSTSNRR